MTSQSTVLTFVRRVSAVVSLAVFVFVALAAQGCDHRAQPMVRSVPVALGGGPADPKVIEGAIEMSFARRHWQIKEHAPGRYVAEYAEKGHSATVAVMYDPQSARIDYVDSSGLLYANGPEGEVIHRNYNNWVKNLANDLRINMSQAQLSASSSAPAAPPAPAPAPK
jgi:hypothetical protein